MPELTDPELLACYKNALANWAFTDYVILLPRAFEWMQLELEGWPAKEVARLMFEYVRDGGKIDQQIEIRPEWNDSKYHFDLRIPVSKKLIYFETRLWYKNPDDPDDPRIYVVNIHYA